MQKTDAAKLNGISGDNQNIPYGKSQIQALFRAEKNPSDSLKAIQILFYFLLFHGKLPMDPPAVLLIHYVLIIHKRVRIVKNSSSFCDRPLYYENNREKPELGTSWKSMPVKSIRSDPVSNDFNSEANFCSP